MKWLILIGSYLLGLLKGLSTFFLSGGGVVFLAVGMFTAFISKLSNIFTSNSDTVAAWIDDLATAVQHFQSINFDGFAQVIVYATAVDSLVTYLTSFTAVVLALLTLVLFGVVSAAIAVALPFVLFKVVYFLKKQITSISS